MKPLKIGEVAKRAGTTAPTIRYYEQIGLLPLAGRQAGNQRVYGGADVRILTFIRRCREFDFSLDQTRSLVALLQDTSSSCSDARNLAQDHLVTVRTKLTELMALERTMASLVSACNASCIGGNGPDCVIVADLGKQSAC